MRPLAKPQCALLFCCFPKKSQVLSTVWAFLETHEAMATHDNLQGHTARLFSAVFRSLPQYRQVLMLFGALQRIEPFQSG